MMYNPVKDFDNDLEFLRWENKTLKRMLSLQYRQGAIDWNNKDLPSDNALLLAGLRSFTNQPTPARDGKITMQSKPSPYANLDKCQGFDAPCDRTDAEWHHNGTDYPNERDNWSYLCPECMEASDDFWAEQWRDYYSGKF